MVFTSFTNSNKNIIFTKKFEKYNFISLIKKHQVNVLFGTPYVIYEILELLNKNDNFIKIIGVGGQSFSYDIMRKNIDKLSTNIKFMAVYTSTEAFANIIAINFEEKNYHDKYSTGKINFLKYFHTKLVNIEYDETINK